MNSSPFRIPILSLVILVLLHSAKFSAATITLPGMAIEYDEWMYIPLFEEENVHSIVVLSTNNENQSTKITTMWFIRDNNVWSSFTWRSGNQSTTLTAIKNTANLSEDSDFHWPIPIDFPTENSSSVSKESLTNGLLHDDPMVSIVESLSDPTILLNALVSIGWKASDAVLFESDCKIQEVLDGFAEGFELEFNDIDSGNDIFHRTINDSACQVSSGDCKEYTRMTSSYMFGDGCSGTWVHTGTHDHSTAGNCLFYNHWISTITQSQFRKIRKFYEDCTTCAFDQTRTRTNSLTNEQLDPNAFCPLPSNYVPPVPDHSPCNMGSSDWSSWGDWTPPLPGEPGSPCP